MNPLCIFAGPGGGDDLSGPVVSRIGHVHAGAYRRCYTEMWGENMRASIYILFFIKK